MSPHAVISGASVAGPALAHQLHARGWRTTVVERAPQLRGEGQNIDVRGAAREVVRRMGVEEALLDAGTGEVGLRFVDSDGSDLAAFPAGENDTDGGTAEMEILRGELARVLYDRTREGTDYRFDEQIHEVHDHGDGVSVTLAGGDVVEADVVVVAEGTRSRTRAAVFGQAEVDELGLNIAYLTIPRTDDDDRWWRWFHTSGSRSASLRPDNVGTTRAMLTFLTAVRGLEELERPDQIRILRRTFADCGWQTRRILDVLDDAPFYFDAVAQVRMPSWSTGRTVLLGDAAWSPGPFGTGTSLALVGAYVLAGELATRDDHRAAFTRYEQVMRPFAEQAQDVKPSVIRAVNPSSRAGLALQRGVLRTLGSVPSSVLGLAQRLAGPPTDAVDLPDYGEPTPTADPQPVAGGR